MIEGEDLKMQMITSLQSTSSGRHHYADLCDRQSALKELVSEVLGIPRKLENRRTPTFYRIVHKNAYNRQRYL